jgi:hypothetical protein
MKAINILKQFSREIKKQYSDTNDFANWIDKRSDIETKHDDVVYCIDYIVIGYRKVECELSVHALNSKSTSIFDRYKKASIDPDLKLFLETSFNQLLPLWYDELQEKEEREAEKEVEREREYEKIFETEQSL